MIAAYYVFGATVYVTVLALFYVVSEKDRRLIRWWVLGAPLWPAALVAAATLGVIEICNDFRARRQGKVKDERDG